MTITRATARRAAGRALAATAIGAAVALWAAPAAAQTLPGGSPATAAPPATEPAPAAGPAVPSRPLVVGTKHSPPFAIKGADGSWSGISIELWREVAGELGLDYALRETDLAGLIRGLEDGTLDASVAALTVTAEREARIDFSYPFYTSGLGIAVAGERRAGWLGVVAGLFSLRLLQVVALLAAVLLGAGFLVWLFERRRNPEQFGGGVHRGLGSAFWWSAVTMTTVGYGDKAPVTFGGRLVALVWMFTSVIVISGFTAAIASSLTVARLDLAVSGPEDLPRVLVATVPGSTSAGYLDERGIRALETADPGAALAAVAAGEAQAAVYDAPILRYLVNRDYRDRLLVLPQVFERQGYAIGLPAGSPLREPLDRALLARLASPEWGELVERYVGEE